MADDHDDGGSRPFPAVLDADRWLLDRQLLDVDGLVAGMVDDLEFSDPRPGESPVLVGLLCGRAALGLRIGGRLGVWWSAIALRLRGPRDRATILIPVEVVGGHHLSGLQLRTERGTADTQMLADWTRKKIVQRIPGSRR